MTTVSIEHLFRAQFGEDRILWQVFQGRTTGFFIEVGAFDGQSLSNTYFLEQLGWHGILVEPIPELCAKAEAVRSRSHIINAAVSKRGSSGTANFTVAQNIPVLSFLKANESHVQRCIDEGATLAQIEVPVTTLDDVILHTRDGDSAIPSPWIANQGWQIDLISIDVEGGELDVLDGLSLDRFKPLVLVLENDRPSGHELEEYLNERGYRKFHRQKINDFYVCTDSRAADLRLEGLAIPA